MEDFITLAEGSGGKEMEALIKRFRLLNRGSWENCDDDASTLDFGDGRKLVFTTDSFIVDPVFFPGGDIGHLAVCGTINDLAVMGAEPLGLSLSFVIEEGFSRDELDKIIASINNISEETGVPIVTGDTKVTQKGKLDKIMINTSGVGIVKKDDLLTKKIMKGDRIILSGGLGEHAVALLSKRFDYETSIVSDSKPLVDEIMAVRSMIKIARDITRGGIAAVLNELSQKYCVSMLLQEESIPVKKEVRNVTEMLGIDIYELASEGRFVCIASEKNAQKVEKELQRFNKDAKIVGEIIDGSDKRTDDKSGTINVIIQTMLGKRLLPAPIGRIVPRIC